ncbi:penicillin-binding protein [Halalkalibacillus sediminis]|uniref:serine-type D-Ala-D-Ala carboxypeptidase n=1 Tax=Halalkalibacillus sediminis TaxID=2018042 RepID=A0A2I0QW17_9BACI|nr:penicillin-binding protein [Halalkalibacillus sediminis]PKR78533.1 penicillin-binding protein [Halalkalibacillus sediminis]
MRKLNQNSIVLIFVVTLFSALFLLIVGRFMYIQVTGEVHSVDLVDYADKFRDMDHNLSAERGKIVDRTGMVLADNKPTYRLYAVLDEDFSKNSPTTLHVENFEKTAKKLAPHINKTEEEIYDILTNGAENDRFQVEFGRESTHLSEDEMQKIESLDLTGLNFERSMERYYPNGSFASHVIGFTDLNDEGDPVGAYGVEEEFDDSLQGIPGNVQYQRDKYGYKLRNAEETVKPPDHGDDVYLTLDQKIQTFLEDAMTTVQNEYNPSRIMAAVMDPKTGEILAMSNRPSFNPNTRENIENWYNDVIAYPFEPGSTLKMFTMAAAIEEGVYNGDETYESGRYRINENFRYVNDYNNRGWGTITYDEGFRRSSNVAMVKLLWEKLGPDKYLEYLKEFNLDRKTGIDLTGEQLGEISYRYPSDQLSTSFGQGSTFTPIQLMKAATMFANEGEMKKPYMISSVIDSASGKVLQENTSETVGQPISAETANHVKKLMEDVVTEEDGTGKRFRLENFTTFGKTGTAQIPDPDSAGYMNGAENYIFSFLGMAPKEEPELMMYIAVKQPEVNHYSEGGDPVSYIYRTVMENSLHYLEVEPDREQTNFAEPILIEDVAGKNVKDVEKKLSDEGVNVVVIGNGDTIKSVSPSEGSEILPNQKVIIKTEGKNTVPDLEGWTLRDVLRLGEVMSVDVDFVGTGFVTEQNIAPNGQIKEGGRLVVELSNQDSNQENDEDSEDSTQENSGQTSDQEESGENSEVETEQE